MNILLVEDGEYKSERVSEFLNENIINANIDVRGSYSSAAKALLSGKYQIAILDMTLPTFDKSNGSIGGDSKTYGGLDLARFIKRKKINLQFLFLSQYKSFSESAKLSCLDDINNIAKKEYPDLYLGSVFYEHAGFKWKDELLELVKSL